jgi:hypothetical protein
VEINVFLDQSWMTRNPEDSALVDSSTHEKTGDGRPGSRELKRPMESLQDRSQSGKYASADLCQESLKVLSKDHPMTNDNLEPSYKLTFDDAVQIWLMRWDGQIQSRIAAHFDVNAGRVNEVLKERKFLGSRQEAEKFRNSAA